MNQLTRALSVIAVLALLAVLAFVAKAWYDSRLPGTYAVMDYGTPEYGGGAATGHHHNARTSVADLVAAPGRLDVRFTLTAKKARIRLDSGKEIDALTFNGQVPGPELRVHQGDLVEVTLLNEDLDDGIAVHWHGVDVPNREDGVAGVTQDAVRPGESYTYRFRAEQLGTFWYHSHQFSANEVARGLYGPFVIEPRTGNPAGELDLSVPVHTFGTRRVFGTSDGFARRPVEASRPVRLRLINTDDTPREFVLRGTPFRVLAVDGVDLTDPQPLEAAKLTLGAGGRYDLGFTMPATAVTLSELGSKAGIVFGPPAATESPPTEPTNEFDPGSYGSSPKLPFTLASHFDREFKVEITKKLGFLNGKPGRHWAINGKLYPDMPMPVVHEGELVKLTFVNHSGTVHPMHLHGHHVLVLSRNGKPVRTPWWVDILDVGSGDTYETGFRATNSGIWMLHCHNLPHAQKGLVMHLTYDGVTTPFRVGGHAHNHPE
ncbi:MAG TPA: multicopper oxidase family protein [Gaiellaceae bacterium]|nr:multicopper oxidase family protein [Gaiellaceae bacterium]